MTIPFMPSTAFTDKESQSTVYAYDAEGKPSVTVPNDSPVKQAVHRIFDQLSL